MMRTLNEMGVLCLLILSLLNTELTWAKRGGGSSGGRKTSSAKWGTQSKPSNSQPGNYPRQPQIPSNNPKPYPPGGSYPGSHNTNPGGYPRQNPPSYPGAGRQPNQNPGGGGYPHQNPAGGGGLPNQNPGRGGYPHQNPAGGGYNPYPGGGSYPGRNNPNQYPVAGGYPVGGNYPNQYPGGGYPVRGGNTAPGWGVPGANPGSYPGRAAGAYPNWNPNNKILSPRYGGGGYGYGGYGGGGSPFSRSVQSMGIQPKTSGFAKKAMVAAGVGALAGMAVGYGLGRFPRPHFSFRNPEEEYYYNNYMYRQYGAKSTDERDYGRDYVYKPPPRAETYENFMKRCMNQSPLSNAKGGSSSSPKSSTNKEEDDDVVSIEEIGYPALIEQVNIRRCVEEYMSYSKKFLQERKFEQQHGSNRGCPMSFRVMQLFTSGLLLLSFELLL